MLVTERPGRLRLIGRDGKIDPRPIAGVPTVAATGQGGLLDVVLHPGFETNGWVYLSYAAGGEGGYGVITSYSIHYTKLYESSPSRGYRLMPMLAPTVISRPAIRIG